MMTCFYAGWIVFLTASLASASAEPAAPLTITLKDALDRARNYNQALQAAVIATSLAHEDRVQAKAATLPTVTSLNQFIYTQGNGTPSGVFVANDGVHVYNNQAVVHQDLFSVARRADLQRATAAEAVAHARQDIAARGVALTVVQGYYALVTAQRRYTNARQSTEEARRFLDITEKQERGGEAAHSDVIKAQLQLQLRERDVQEAKLAGDKARITLAVLLFPDFRQDFTVVDDLESTEPLPPFGQVQAQATARSPELKAAQATVQQETAGISVARSAFFPIFALDYFFGINANQFAIRTNTGRQNLGSVAQATLTIPVWNWGSTQSKVRQAELRRKQAQFELTLGQRQLIATVNSSYFEAQTALAQLDSLRSSLNLATESLRLTFMRYQAGEATALEVADAQTTLVQSRNAYDDGLSRYRIALANIQNLTGNI